MADALGPPYWFWGGACAAFSAIVLLVGLWVYIKPRRARTVLAAEPAVRAARLAAK